MSSFLTINENNFPDQVLKATSPVIVEFGAVWCAPCKRLEPIMEKLGDEWGGKVRLVKIDVDESANVAINCQVMSVPTLILFVQGQEKQRLTGLQPRERIIEKFTPFFKGKPCQVPNPNLMVYGIVPYLLSS